MLPFMTTWMNLENMLSEISHTEKDKHYMVSLICRIIKLQQTNEYNKKEAHSQIEQISHY